MNIKGLIMDKIKSYEDIEKKLVDMEKKLSKNKKKEKSDKNLQNQENFQLIRYLKSETLLNHLRTTHI